MLVVLVLLSKLVNDVKGCYYEYNKNSSVTIKIMTINDGWLLLKADDDWASFVCMGIKNIDGTRSIQCNKIKHHLVF